MMASAKVPSMGSRESELRGHTKICRQQRRHNNIGEPLAAEPSQVERGIKKVSTSEGRVEKKGACWHQGASASVRAPQHKASASAGPSICGAPEDVVRIRSHGLTRNVSSEVRRAQVACAAGLEADKLRVKALCSL